MAGRGWVAGVLALLMGGSAGAVTLPVAQRILRNGLTVLVHEDHSLPVVSSYVFFKSGSRNEHTGTTGIAHLFEHMMFNGGRKFGPGVFDDLIEGNGGSTNGYTTRDLTAYLNNVPREALPIVFDLESDRMAHLAITPKNLEQERGIVAEERRMRIDNEVSGSMQESLYLAAFVRSPYRWNTVGFMADIESITLAEARAYFETSYAPNNAILVLAGDVQPESAFALAERYFGRIPRRPPPPPVNAAEPAQEGERRVTLRRQAELPAVLIGYHAVAATDADRPALDVTAQILSGGESARLFLDLVREHELATTVDADLDWTIDPDLFTIYAQARPGHTTLELERRIDAVLDRLGRELVATAELTRARRELRAQAVKGLKTVSGKANKIGFAQIVFGDYHRLFDLEDRWDAVTAADIQRVVAHYLVPTQRTVVVVDPLRAAPPGAGR